MVGGVYKAQGGGGGVGKITRLDKTPTAYYRFTFNNARVPGRGQNHIRLFEDVSLNGDLSSLQRIPIDLFSVVGTGEGAGVFHDFSQAFNGANWLNDMYATGSGWYRVTVNTNLLAAHRVDVIDFYQRSAAYNSVPDVSMKDCLFEVSVDGGLTYGSGVSIALGDGLIVAPAGVYNAADPAFLWQRVIMPKGDVFPAKAAQGDLIYDKGSDKLMKLTASGWVVVG